MRQLTVLGAAAILASTAAFMSTAQAAGCAQYDPTCATYPMPKQGDNTTGTPMAARAEARVDTGRYHHHHRYYRSAYRGERPEGPGEFAGDVVGGAIGTAGAITAGAINTAGAIATAPFRGPDSYAYYNGYNNGWSQQSYAERNGFVCTPGTFFKGADGRRHPCQ